MITKEIVQNCTNVIKQNLQKIIFAVMAMFFISQIFLVFTFAFALISMSVSGFLGIIVLLAILAFVFGLFYGFCALILLFARKQYAVIGHLFCGFKNFKRLFQSSIPFVLIIFASCFVSSLISLNFSSNTDPLQALNDGTMPNVLMFSSYAAVILAIILYLPLIFTPFCVFDFSTQSVKVCQKKAILIFKSTYKIIFKSFLLFCRKNLSLLLACAVFAIFSSNIKGLAIISTLALPCCTILVYIIFVKSIVLCAVVYNQFLIEQNEQSSEQTNKIIQIAQIEKVENGENIEKIECAEK